MIIQKQIITTTTNVVDESISTLKELMRILYMEVLFSCLLGGAPSYATLPKVSQEVD